MNDTSTNPLMFQVLFFFSVISCKKIFAKSLQKSFQFIFPLFYIILQKNNAWNIRRLVDGQNLICPINPARECTILKIVGFLVYISAERWGLCGKNKKLILLLAGATITLLIDCTQRSEKKVQIINLNPFKTNVQSNLKSYWSRENRGEIQ